MTPGEAASYKARKEAFVSNLSGSSLTDINLVTLVAPAAILLWTALQKRQSLFTPYGVVGVVLDFMLNVCAILFAFTAYSSAPVLLNVLLAVPATILLLPLVPASKKTRSNNAKNSSSQSRPSLRITTPTASAIPNRPFLTNYRGAMMIATCMAILAVDFPVFPRRFAKVETWGTSLMDLGVGSFVFSAGVVSARQLLTTASASSKIQRRPLHTRLLTSLRHSTPLLVLGLIRLYSVKGLDYAEHVTEYGVHWNFFFTLALLPPSVELSDTLIRNIFRSYDLLAILIALTYETVLNSTDLLSYILISPRGPSLLSKNREGIFSFIGYLAVFLSGRSIGTRILPFSLPPAKTKGVSIDQTIRTERLKILTHLLVSAVAYSLLFLFCTSYQTANIRVSRRLANSSYVFWIAAYNNFQLLLFALVEHVGVSFVYPHLHPPVAGAKKDHDNDDDEANGPEVACSKIMQSFNKNGLVVFLGANLLTGLVNLTVNTLDVSWGLAMGILISYAAAVTGLAVGLDVSGIKIKF